MKIDYILSDRTKTATTNALSRVVLQAKEDKLSNFVIIVPETKSIIIEKELLKISPNGAFANIFVYSFVRLLNRLDFVKKEKIISKQSAVMLIRKIIYDNFDELDCYKKTAKNINFAEKIYDTLQQFKSSNVSVDDLKQAYIQAESSLKAKLKDIVFIYQKYEEMLAGVLYDDCDKLNLIKQFAKTSDFIKNSHIFIVGFDNITNEMVGVLEELAKNSKSITFSCVYFSEKRQDKYIQNNELYLKFRRVADNLKYPYIPSFNAAHLKGDFFAVANKLFVPNIKQQKYNGDIKIFAAKNKEQEIRFVASKILELVGGGALFNEIGVLCESLENDSELIKKIFEEQKINYFINQEIDISNHCLIAFIKLCFELYQSHLSSEKVLKFLKSEFLNIDGICELENFVYEYGLNYNDFLKPLKKEFEEKCSNFEKYSKILYDFQCFYQKFAEKIKNTKSTKDYCEIILWIINYFDLENKLIELSKFQQSLDMQEDARVSEKILEKLKDFLGMVENFLGLSEISNEEFLQVFLTGFSVIKLNLSPASIDCVVVQGDTDGFYDIKYMFLMGADENNFPKVITDSGIILDSEIEKTNILSGKVIEPMSKDINAREKFIAYESLVEPKEKLFISYSQLASDGTIQKPSRILKLLLTLFDKDKIILKDYKNHNFVSKQHFVLEFARHIGEFIDGDGMLYDLNKEYATISGDVGESFKNYLFNYQQNTPDFEILGAKDLYFTNQKTSSSQLEKYFSCPYMFFANYGLRLKENKNAKLSKLDIGVILHKVAEIFVKNIDKFEKLEEKDLTQKIELYVQNIFDKLMISKSKNSAMLKFLFEESKRLCLQLLKEQSLSSFKTVQSEFSFAGDNAFLLTLSNGEKLKLEGKIDRIDKWGEYVRIIDYKTGDIDADLFSIYFGKKIQLLSYLSVVQQLSSKNVAGIFYIPIHSDYVKNAQKIEEKYKMNGYLLNDIEVIKHMDNSLSFDNPKSNLVPITIKSNADVVARNVFELSRAGSKFLTDKEFDDLKNYIENLCENAATEILSGYIEPSPLKKGDDDNSLPCNFCEFAGFCGLEKARFSKGRSCGSNININSFKEGK